LVTGIVEANPRVSLRRLSVMNAKQQPLQMWVHVTGVQSLLQMLCDLFEVFTSCDSGVFEENKPLFPPNVLRPEDIIDQEVRGFDDGEVLQCVHNVDQMLWDVEF
jgi:hypothetical protein